MFQGNAKWATHTRTHIVSGNLTKNNFLHGKLHGGRFTVRKTCMRKLFSFFRITTYPKQVRVTTAEKNNIDVGTCKKYINIVECSTRPKILVYV